VVDLDPHARAALDADKRVKRVGFALFAGAVLVGRLEELLADLVIVRRISAPPSGVPRAARFHAPSASV
jgi:hypothetical protein